jgi:hypothetical protein
MKARKGKADEVHQQEAASDSGEWWWMHGELALDFGQDDTLLQDFDFDANAFSHLGAAATNGVASVDHMGHVLQDADTDTVVISREEGT